MDAHVRYSIGDNYLRVRGRRKPVSLHERWVGAGMGPDRGIKGETAG